MMDKIRAKEILITYKDKSDLFNWCDEYSDFVDKNVYCLMNEEAEYMLKQSWEDSESPLSYDDVDLNDYDTLKERIVYEIENTYKEEEKQKDLREEINLCRNGSGYFDIEKGVSFEDFLNDLDNDELQTIGNDIFQIEAEPKEIFQWFIVSSRLAHMIKEEGGVILNENWFGRECCGQALSLDSMFINIYLDILKNWFTEDELFKIRNSIKF